MTTTPAFHQLYAALKAGDVLDDDTETALGHLQSAEDAMLKIGMLLTSCTDRPREMLGYIADAFADYGWARPERASGRDESGTGPAERWLFEASGDQPLIRVAWVDVADAQGMDDEFHPRKDEEEDMDAEAASLGDVNDPTVAEWFRERGVDVDEED